ncbi:GntP family permease [Belliella aquatica]|uniref:Permease n=1 Tax=Belliella aquatica TaxID=1323734 RepID=A0ABQ1MMZ6_9BACT|nr:GntP family permease [Belliella aquatica]MCH7405323.1 GntP family permease [Belliella aquatica]GGC42553.1 permease [Belliella aquatica]
MWILLHILLAILWIVLSTSKFKIHPLIALFFAAIYVGVTGGLGFLDSLEVFTAGFGALIGQVGMVIILGSIFGILLDQSRAAISIANFLWNGIGKRFPALSTTFLGSVVGIPVFCDSGFILLNPIGKNLAKTSGFSPLLFSISLAGGLYATHILIPPTPGPLAVAGLMGMGSYLGKVLIIGLAVLIPVILVTAWWARKLKVTQVESIENTPDQPTEFYQNTSVFWSVATIVIPLLLITLGNLEQFFQNESIISALGILGHPIIAISVGMGIGFLKLRNPTDGQFLVKASFEKGILTAGPILVLTGAGAGFGAVLKGLGLEELIQGSLLSSENGLFWILIAFSMAAFFKTAQGSSTSAMVISASIFLSIVPASLVVSSTQSALFIAAIGAGAMTVSHANDSYFWIVKEFSGLSVKEALKYYTSLTGLMGLTALLMVLFLHFILI